MRDDLLYYYERELSFLRHMGADFAKRYPKVASRLLLEPTKCEDPHVERLLEGFAFLAARTHLRLDDDFPEISEALLNLIYPHYIRPIPSMSLVQFELDPDQASVTSGFKIPRGTQLYSRPVSNERCRFVTCYDTTLWPITVSAAQWTAPDRLRPAVRVTDAVAALRLELRCQADLTFAELDLDTLRVYLSSEGNLTSSLYELLCNNCVRVMLRDPDPKSKRAPIVLPSTAIRAVGFEDEEGMLPYPRRSFLGYRVLQEYFTFPEKFHFLDISGFAEARAAGFGGAVEVVFLISAFERADRRQMIEAGVGPSTFSLGCAPAINLFRKESEPIALDQRRPEYVVEPSNHLREAYQVYSVDDVMASTVGSAETVRFHPFYAHRHRSARDEKCFWYAARRPTPWRRDGSTEVYLTFVDLSGRVAHPEHDAITAYVTCFNGDLPSLLPFGNEAGDFELPGGGPIRRVLTRVKPTPVVQPPLGKPQLWRLISQLSLNYLSLVDGGADALREVLRLHNFLDSASVDRQIDGLVNVRSSPVHSRVVSEHGISFARGRRVEIEFDESQYAGGSVYLFASVLERFLGMYVSLNSFTTLAARTQQRKGLLREWAPRSGWKALA
jgi:type VI secretion system protein ImpG